LGIIQTREASMKLNDHVRLMAEYNRWMNEKIYQAASKISHEQLNENKGAFFGSIVGTFNHIAVADIFWLKRFALALPDHKELDSIRQLPLPQALDSVLFADLSELKSLREVLDESLSAFANSVSETELHGDISFKNTKDVVATKNLFSLLMHVFNHQTHHRGQVTTLFSQLGVDVGVTDLAAIIPSV
jgi:uncharacterized damage-inducible protein DinB